MRDKVIEIIKTMRGQAAIEDVMGEKTCSFYLNDYANQLEEAVKGENMEEKTITVPVGTDKVTLNIEWVREEAK